MDTPNASPDYKPLRWYSHPTFSLVPQLIIRPANTHNTVSISFFWLFLRLWTLDTFAFELAIVCDTHWGIGIIGILPYLRWNLVIPCPMWLETIVRRYLYRRPESLNN